MFDKIEHSEFMSEFFIKVEWFCAELFKSFNRSIVDEPSTVNWSSEEIAGLIILNKLLFQHIRSFFVLTRERLSTPAFNGVRSSMEVFRLLRLYIQDESFRKEYLINPNTDFRKKKDKEFMQSVINKRLEEIEKDFKLPEGIPFAHELKNHNFTKGSNFSQTHSELSKWSHALNVNLIFPMHTDGKAVNLSITDECNEYSEYQIKRYTESILVLSFYYCTMLSFVIKKEKDIILNYYEIMNDFYKEFIEKYYKF